MRTPGGTSISNTEIPATVRPEELALMLGVQSITIRFLLNEGRIRGIKLPRTWLIPRAEVERILELMGEVP